MPTLAPEDVLAASDFLARDLTRAKRQAIATIAQLTTTIDPDAIAETVDRILPAIVQVMNQQQAAGRVAAWKQAQLALSLVTDFAPGEAILPISAARDGAMLSGLSFEGAVAPTTPGILSRIGSGISPQDAIKMGERVLTQMAGSVAHDEARATTQDIVTSNRPGAHRLNGYARRTEGAYSCDFCRMLATRGPVYTESTAGFRAHAFCDCTVYAVAMQDFSVDPGDWDAYQRWAKSPRSGGTSGGGANLRLPGTATAERLAAIDAQLASYEPLVQNGAGTEWMRNRVEELRAERTALVNSGIPEPTSTVTIPDRPAPRDLRGTEYRELSTAEAVEHRLSVAADATPELTLSRVADAKAYADEWDVELETRRASLAQDREALDRRKAELKEERRRLKESNPEISAYELRKRTAYYSEEVKRWEGIIVSGEGSVQAAIDLGQEARDAIPIIEKTGHSWATVTQAIRAESATTAYQAGPLVVRVHGPMTDKIAKGMDDLLAMPEAVHTRLAAHFAERPGAGFYFGEANVPELDSLQFLSGRQPRGWADGSVWDEVPGVYSPGGRVAAIGGGPHGSTSIAVHEASHAVDDAVGVATQTPEFRSTWDGILDAVGEADVDPYFTRIANPDGAYSECFAEGYAALVKGRASGLTGGELAGAVGKALTRLPDSVNIREAFAPLIAQFLRIESTVVG